MLNRAILEKNNPRADLVLGINNSELDKSFQYGIWEPYRSPKMDQVPKMLQIDPEHRVTPFDYGYIAFVYDSERIQEPPQSLEDPGRIRKKGSREESPPASFQVQRLMLLDQSFSHLEF